MHFRKTLLSEQRAGRLITQIREYYKESNGDVQRNRESTSSKGEKGMDLKEKKKKTTYKLNTEILMIVWVASRSKLEKSEDIKNGL